MALHGTIGQVQTQTVHVGAPGPTPLSIVARLANRPPFAATLRTAVDGTEVARRSVGVLTGLLYEVQPDLDPGEHILEISFLPPGGRG